MKQITAGIVAHVDAGKTTLSEALMYHTGARRELGRVDNGTAFLDPDALEKARGITIFSHQARFNCGDLAVTLLDTPGHVDFASQTEQVLSVLDYAILVVAAGDGVTGYTRTLWHLLADYQVPTFIFVNKMDAPGVDQAGIIAALQAQLAPGAIDMTAPDAQEQIAMLDEAVLDDYLANETLSTATIQSLIAQRQLFPVYWGAALKLDGIGELLDGLAAYTQEPAPQAEFAARVFKITRDPHGERLSWVRVYGGRLKPKAVVVPGEKINELRVYNGEKFTTVPELGAGQVGALTGLVNTHPGMALGDMPKLAAPVMQPVLTYALDPQQEDIHACLKALRELEDEDPNLHVTWREQVQELQVQVMGQIQLEVLTQLLKTRFALNVGFDAGSVLYKETITGTAEGAGHFEPLRHYAEVHLLLEPGAPNSGLTIDSTCSLEMLTRNYQHQVFENLRAKTQLGTLVGAPLTDVHITLVSGRASIKHSVGGDFKEATWRALRQGLMVLRTAGECQLLEPWYHFELSLAPEFVGRAMTDIQQMGGEMAAPVIGEANTTLSGRAPVAAMQHYAATVRTYTHGQGVLELVVAGYYPAHDQAAIVEARGYDPVADVANTPDSVFCAHGAGYPVRWDRLPEMAHVPYQSTQSGAKRV